MSTIKQELQAFEGLYNAMVAMSEDTSVTLMAHVKHEPIPLAQAALELGWEIDEKTHSHCISVEKGRGLHIFSANGKKPSDAEKELHEVTLDEIADKLGIDVDTLRIKE